MGEAGLQQRSADDVATLTDLNLGYVQSVQDADTRWFERNLAADFLNTNSDGSLVDRQAFLAQIARGAGVSGLVPGDVVVRVFGDFAIIHAITTYTRSDGQRGAGRYTDIWARRDGRWVCVAAHVTRG
jgi:ketosteroid isomerase-like protein